MENHNPSTEIYTLGIWIVKPGKEQEFIDKWASFAKWTGKQISGNGKAYLLQDENNPLRFISFGPWNNKEVIQKWRESNEFKDFVASVKLILDDFQPNTLKTVATSE